MSNRVTHFEIPSENPEVNMQFFKDAFGWDFEQAGSEPYWLIRTGDEGAPGINGAVTKKRDQGQPLVNTITVPDLGESIRKIGLAGGYMVVPKHAIPEVGWVAFFMDPDGNMHGVMQEDKEAR